MGTVNSADLRTIMVRALHSLLLMDSYIMKSARPLCSALFKGQWQEDDVSMWAMFTVIVSFVPSRT